MLITPIPRLAISGILILASCSAASTQLQAADESRPTIAQLQARIAGLIEQLGAEQYAQRERAQEELKQLGLVAFDALIEAQRHPDIEVALRSRYLVRSMPIRWTRESDPIEVKNLLRNYMETSRADRKTRMQALADMEDSQGIEALCRLVRFETDNLLSKQAALLAINHVAPTNEVKRDQLADRIRQTVGLSKRDGADWMRAYAGTLEDPESSLVEWERITRSEQTTFSQFPEETRRELVRDLLRWQAELLRGMGRQEESMDVIRRTLDVVRGDREEMFDFVDWALEREAWYVVDEIAERFADDFFQDPDLVYRLAEAQRKRGDHDLARETAGKALALNPERADRHVEAGVKLMMRQMYDWSENELRYVIDSQEKENRITLESRFVLSDMLFDIGEEKKAADVLREVVDVISGNGKLLQLSTRSIGSIRGSMHYYYAMHHAEAGDRAEQIEHLQQAIKFSPGQPDYLIAMFRVPDPDDDWTAETVKRIDAAKGRLKDQIARYEKTLLDPRSEQERILAIDQLATAYNEFAWLVSNTLGDFDQALERSHKSLELVPNSPAYLDTLARCYYAKGDLENAVKFQSMAAERAPYYQQIQRQLERFRKELAEQRPSDETGTDEADS